jgi:NAD(P)-dependent dehydrogenase (short-subunit alcohol dehydrogenase family)
MPPAQYLGAAPLARGEVPADLKPASAPANQFRYATSKLCILLYMYELGRRLRAAGSRVTVTTFDPSLMPGTGPGQPGRRALGVAKCAARAAALLRRAFYRDLRPQPGVAGHQPRRGGGNGQVL